MRRFWLVLGLLGCTSTSTNPSSGGANGAGGSGGSSALGGTGGASGGASGSSGQAGGGAGGASGAGGGVQGCATSSSSFAQTCDPGVTYCHGFDADPTALIEIAGGNWSWSPGDRIYQQTNPDSQCVAWIGPRPSWSNYTLRARVRIDSGGQGIANAGLVLRVVGPGTGTANTGNFYYFGIGLAGLVFGHVNAGWKLLFQYQHTYQPGVWYELAVQVSGGTFTLFLDQNQIGSANDPNLTVGAVGFRTYDTAASFDDVIVNCL